MEILKECFGAMILGYIISFIFAVVAITKLV